MASSGSPDGISFDGWLNAIGQRYRQQTSEERNHTLDFLIDISPAPQLYHLSERLNRLLKRDFFVQLPHELSFHIIQYLDANTLLVCCQVSKPWNTLISTCASAWKRLCQQVGMANSSGLDSQPGDPSLYKQLYLSTRGRLEALKAGRAIEASLLFGHTDRVMAIYYKDERLASGSDDHTVRIWDCKSGICTHVLHTHTVADVKMHAGWVITASFDTTAAIWDIHSGQCITQFQGHVAAVFSVDFNVELDILVTGSADSTVKIWRLSTGEMLKTLPQHRSAWIIKVKLYWNKWNNFYFILSRDNVSIHMWKMTLEHEIDLMDDLENPHNDLVPGLQVSGPVIMFAAMDTDNKCHVIQRTLENPTEQMQRISYNVSKDSYMQAYLGGGDHFDTVLVMDGEQPKIDIVRHAKQEVVTSVTLPLDYRPSKRSSTFCLGDGEWLNGFDNKNHQGVFFATSLRDNSIYLLKWKPSTAKTH